MRESCCKRETISKKLKMEKSC